MEWLWVLLAVPVAVVCFLGVAWFVPAVWRPWQVLCVHLLFRFRIYHRDRIPVVGGVLLLPNHTTYLDWLLLIVASPRPVKFVISESYYRTPLLRMLLSFGRSLTIRIPRGSGKVHTIHDVLKQVAAELDQGNVVVYFAEQHLTRNGQMLPFARGVEKVLSHCRKVPCIIPVYLDNLWGTLLSWSNGKMFWKKPEGPFRRRVAVYFGTPLAATAKAGELRSAVVEAGARCGMAQSDFLLPTPAAFVRQAATWRHLFSLAFVDYATGTERKLTWSRTLVAVWSLRNWLRPRLSKSHNIGVWMPTSLGSALVNTAVNFLGKTTVNLNYTAGANAVTSAIHQAEVTQVVTSRRFCDKVPLTLPYGVEAIYLEEAMVSMTKTAMLVKLVLVILLPGWLLDRLFFKLNRLELDQPQTILFSSGTTNEPKGVVLSYRNIAANVDSFRRGVEFHDTDRMLVTLPFFHCFGYTVSLWACMVVGMEAVVFPDPRQAKEIGEHCKQHACTILLGTATFLRFYLKRAEVDDFRSLRLIVCGAEKLPVKLAEEFRDRFGILPYEGYGCTELSPVVSTNLPNVTLNGVTQKANNPGTVGKPIPNICTKTFDPETYAMLPHGHEGLLGCLGANVMHGYLNRPDQTQLVRRDGWYISGDVGIVEDAGFIRITGRVSRFAKIAGEMVPLEQLDDRLHEILGSCGERKLAVTAVPDDKRGERIIVLHTAEVTEHLQVLFQQLKAAQVPNLWIPDVRDCRVVESFPILATGKLDLKKLGEIARELTTQHPVKAVLT